MKNIIKNKLNIYCCLMRINKPTGLLLLLWPTYCGLWVASRGIPNLYILFVFTLGVFLMRSSGCVINDFIDKKIDVHVKRTMYRPLLINTNISNKEVIILFIILNLLSFLLIIDMKVIVRWLSLFAILLIIFYPFAKRLIYFPQVVLGIAFGWSIPMGYAAVVNDLPFECWLLLFINVVWSMIYDTMYAMADRYDDVKIGVKSTAIFFNKFDKLVIGFLQIFMFILLIYFGILINLRFIYFINVVVVLFLFIFQQKLIMTRDPKLCLKAFHNNVYVGFFLFFGILLNYLNIENFLLK